MTKSIDNNYILGSNSSSNRFYNMNSFMNNNFSNLSAVSMSSNNNDNCCMNISNNNSNSCCMNNCDNNSNNNSDRANMLKEIMSLDFALTELQLYLNNHPEDEKALCLYKKYAKELKELKDRYQKVYGPLTKEFPCNKWRWIEEPWPWEGGIF